jgi:uncharacterized protein YbjT (DUF2867 family)
MSKKIIAVIGATGAQGGALVNAILARGGSEWGVRAVTRDPNSEKARALASRGVEVVGGDADDPSSLDRAFAGAYGAFCVTAFWEHFSPEKELTQAANMANAAARAGVQHALWSTLEDTRVLVPLTDDRMPTLQGKYKVPHFDAKGEANALFAKAGVPTTLFHTSFYWDNLIHFGMGPKPGPDGKLAFTLPMADEKLPGIAAEDIGKCALGVFARGEEFAGKSIGIAGEHLSGGEMAEALSRALERPVAYNYVPPEVYRTFGFPGADDLANMFQYKRDFAPQFRALRSVEFSRSLNPELQSFARWLAANKARIPLS